MSAGLKVDGASQGKIIEGQNKTLSFSLGTQHVISVDQYVNTQKNVTRYYAAQNSWTATAAAPCHAVSCHLTHVFQYQTQYLLTEQVGIKYGSETFYGPPCSIPSLLVCIYIDWSFFKTTTNTTAGQPLATTHWYPAGTTVTIGQPVDAVSLPQGAKGVNGTLFFYWGYGLGPSNSQLPPAIVTGTPPPALPTIVMNEPQTLITYFDLRYRLWLVSEYGNPQLQGGYGFTVVQASNPTVVSEWYEEGTTATATVTSPVGVPIQEVVDGWNCTCVLEGSSTSSSTVSASVKMQGPTILYAGWSASYNIVIGIAVGVSAAAIIAIAAKYFGWNLRPPLKGPGPVEEPVEEF
jgi:hypothetical protein